MIGIECYEMIFLCEEVWLQTVQCIPLPSVRTGFGTRSWTVSKPSQANHRSERCGFAATERLHLGAWILPNLWSVDFACCGSIRCVLRAILNNYHMLVLRIRNTCMIYVISLWNIKHNSLIFDALAQKWEEHCHKIFRECNDTDRLQTHQISTYPVCKFIRASDAGTVARIEQLGAVN